MIVFVGEGWEVNGEMWERVRGSVGGGLGCEEINMEGVRRRNIG